MSEREFETYLSLMCKLLRLNQRQRDAIACELRDHLEQRLDELREQGVSRDAAIDIALEEFGDAAGLAGEFQTIANRKTRRRIMQTTFGTMAACAAIILGTTYLLPENRPGMPEQPVAHAQDGSRESTASGEAKSTETIVPSANDRVREILDTKRVPVRFEDVQLSMIVDYFRDSLGINIFVDQSALDEVGVGSDTQTSLSLSDVRASTALNLTLRSISPTLTYVIHDGVCVITTQQEVTRFREQEPRQLKVYDVSDLLGVKMSSMSTPRPTAPGGFGAFDAGGREGEFGGGFAPGLPGATRGRRGSGRSRPSSVITTNGNDATNALANTVMSMVHAMNEDTGESIHISTLDSVLVVYASESVHGDVAELLNVLADHVSAKKEKASSQVQPPANVVAMILQGKNAQWSEESQKFIRGDAIIGGPIQLVDGMVKLALGNGSTALLEAPSTLNFSHNGDVILVEGRLTGSSNNQPGRGLRVQTPHADIVDVGTEFGVKVEEDGTTNTHVFDGKAELTPLKAGEQPRASDSIDAQPAEE